MFVPSFIETRSVVTKMSGNKLSLTIFCTYNVSVSYIAYRMLFGRSYRHVFSYASCIFAPYTR